MNVSLPCLVLLVWGGITAMAFSQTTSGDASRPATIPPHDGVPVVLPELGAEFPRVIGGHDGYSDGPVDLVVLGKPVKTVSENASPRMEIEIDRIIWGSCPNKRITVAGESLEEGSRVYALSRSGNRGNGTAYSLCYDLPPTETNAQGVFGVARMDYHALGSPFIFVGEATRDSGIYRIVKVSRVLRGDGLIPGQEIFLNSYNPGDEPRKPKEALLYCCREKDRLGHYDKVIRFPMEMETSLLKALARRDSFPVEEIDEEGEAKRIRRIRFTGSTEEAIRLLESEHDATVSFLCESLIHRGAQIRAEVEKEIRGRLYAPNPSPAEERVQASLCRILAGIDREALATILDELLISLENSGRSKDSANNSAYHLLARLDDGLYLARRYGKRVLVLPEKLGPMQQKVFRNALIWVQLADRIELADAVDRTGQLEVARTQPPPRPPEPPRKPGQVKIPDHSIESLNRTIHFTEDPAVLRTVTHQGVLHTRDAATLEVRSETKLPENHEFVSARSPDGKLALISEVKKREGWSNEYGNYRVIEFDTGKVVAQVPLPTTWNRRHPDEFWLPDDQLLLFLRDKWTKVNIGSGNPSVETVALAGPKDNDLIYGSKHLTEDGRNLFILQGGGKSSTLEVKTYKLADRSVRALGKIDRSHRAGTHETGLVPGGKSFFFAGPGLSIHDRQTLESVIGPLFLTDSVLAISFIPDGSRFAVATRRAFFLDHQSYFDPPRAQTMIRVHDSATGKTLYAFPSPTPEVRRLALSPDAKRLILLRDDFALESYKLP